MCDLRSLLNDFCNNVHRSHDGSHRAFSFAHRCEKTLLSPAIMARNVIRFSSATDADAHHLDAVSRRIRNRKRSS
jgi:hypothetical protein